MGGGSRPRGGNKSLTQLDIARRREKQRDWETCYRTRKRRILRSNTLNLVDESKESLCGRETGRDLRSAPVDARRHLYFIFSPDEQRGGGEGGECAARLFLFCSLFPVQQTTSGIGHRVK